MELEIIDNDIAMEETTENDIAMTLSTDPCFGIIHYDNKAGCSCDPLMVE